MIPIKEFRSYIWKICLGDKLPVWATLLGIIVGAAATTVGTFMIVPSLNESLEKQKIRSDFIIKNLDDLNARTRSLVSDVSDLHYNVLHTNQVDSAAIQKTLTKIAEMQWKAVELAIIFESTKGAIVVQEYQKSLDDVRSNLVNLKSNDDLGASQAAIENFSFRTLNVIRELAVLGGLRLDSSPLLKK
jgi:hypothetical protein